MKKTIRPAIFKWRQTEPELILCAVRGHLQYSLSFRDVEARHAARSGDLGTIRVFLAGPSLIRTGLSREITA